MTFHMGVPPLSHVQLSVSETNTKFFDLGCTCTSHAVSFITSKQYFVFLFPCTQDKKENLSQQKMQRSASPQDSCNVQEDEIKKKRALMADAAEKRLYG